MVGIDVLRRDIYNCAISLCQEMGIELVELRVRECNKDLHIEVLADLPDGSISFDDCARLNRALGLQFDDVLKLGDAYILEVCSPGLDRPLTTVSDFRRTLGRKVRLFLRERVEGKMEMDAVIVSIVENEIFFKTKFGDVKVGIEKIEKAKQVIS